MTDRTQFGDFSCEACEAMCLDAVDGSLTAAELAVFDRHIAGCVECAEQLAEAKRGAAWMEMLKGHRPEPPAGMLQRILAQTSEAEMSKVFPRHGVVPTPRFEVVPVAGKREKLWAWIESTLVLDTRNSHFQPRMAMTAAMAFFSIALSLNLAGVRLGDLKPGSIHRTVADATASAARSIQNMKVVYQVESRVNEFRDDDRDSSARLVGGGDASRQTPTKPAPQDQKPKEPKQDSKQPEPHGTSELVVPAVDGQTAPDAEAPRVQKGA